MQRSHVELFSGFCISCFVVAYGQPAGIGWLGAVSAVCGYALLFWSLRQIKGWHRFFLSALWFCLVQAIELFWMTSLTFPGSSMICVYILLAMLWGLQFGLFSLLITLPLEWKKISAAAALWVVLEWIRLFVFCGFSWNPVGLALCHFDSSLQYASVVGILGLSFWVIGTNLVVFKAWIERSKAVACFACLLALIPYFVRGQFEKRGEKSSLSFALVQTNWLPFQKTPWLTQLSAFIPPLEQWRFLCQKITSLQGVDVVVFPEAAVSFQAERMTYPLSSAQEVLRVLPGFDVEYHQPPLTFPYATLCMDAGDKGVVVSNLFFAQAIANYLHSTCLIGLDHTDKGSRCHFNSLFYLRPYASQVERYDKQILLPLAEYLPFTSLRNWAKQRGFHEFFTPGRLSKQEVLGSKWVPSICYEDTFSHFVANALQADTELLVNVSNDNYYPQSSLYRQHLFHARLRSVENGVPLVRACNGGGTAVINGKGKIEAELLDGKAEVLSYNLTLDRYNTLFSLWGQKGIIAACLAIVGFYLLKFLELKRGQHR